MQATAMSSLLSLVENHLTGLVKEALSVQRHAKRARLHEPTAAHGDDDATVVTAPPTDGSSPPSSSSTSGVVVPLSCFQGQGGEDHYNNSINNINNVVVRRRVHAADIVQALQLRGCETLYATPVVGSYCYYGSAADGQVLLAPPTSDNTITNNNNNNNKSTAAAAAAAAAESAASQKKVMLKDFLQRECYSMSQSMAPTEIGARMHWLAVDGKQPEIPQNPPPLPNIIPSSNSMAGGVGGSGSFGSMLGGGGSSSSNSSRGFVIPDQASAAAATAAGLEIFQLQSAVLSEELQLYFTRVALAMERGSATPENEHQQDVVLQSLACDAGLQELVPFLVRYCQQQLYKHSRRGRRLKGSSSSSSGGNTTTTTAGITNSSAGAGAEHCRTLVRLATSMLRNPHLHLELQLHELLPALMTCVVTDSGTGRSNSKKTLAVASAAAGRGGGGTPTAAADAATTLSLASIGQNNTSHWALRREASLALLTAWQVYGEKYVTLKADALKALCQAIGPDRPLATRYGGFVAISCFGPKAIDAFLLPSILACWKEWEEQLEQLSTRNDLMRRKSKNVNETNATTATILQMEGIRMCQQAALDALNIFLNKVTDEEKAARLSWNELEEPLGDRLVALNGSRGSPYAMCFI